MRGKHSLSASPPAPFGSIPACAGEARQRRPRQASGAVYPRVCGGSINGSISSATSSGLSPRVRGKRQLKHRRHFPARSIPACAGEAISFPRSIPVYPRVCGGSVAGFLGEGIEGGLSPRVRGKRERQEQAAAAEGSIPACAGEADDRLGRVVFQKVYPRVCGGSQQGQQQRRPGCGLSPSVRGKPPLTRLFWPCTRSIPACAGEAIAGLRRPVGEGVYPRVCGGSSFTPLRCSVRAGLSPRVRGKPWVRRGRIRRMGSIPACAGEASSPVRLWCCGWVYPRVCGGSIIRLSACPWSRGLSPRVRGKLYVGIVKRPGRGSIPACAGEAGRCGRPPKRRRVYPRVCGGSRRRIHHRIQHRGLSPRVRGKRRVIAVHHRHIGSIPACAGEALHRRHSWQMRKVYPRVCGGSRNPRPALPFVIGLSPRVRGKP